MDNDNINGLKGRLKEYKEEVGDFVKRHKTGVVVGLAALGLSAVGHYKVKTLEFIAETYSKYPHPLDISRAVTYVASMTTTIGSGLIGWIAEDVEKGIKKRRQKEDIE